MSLTAEPNIEIVSSILRRVNSEPGGYRLEMMCPRCQTWTDAALGYKSLQMIEEHKDALNPIVKCMNKDCGHAFSPKWLVLQEMK